MIIGEVLVGLFWPYCCLLERYVTLLHYWLVVGVMAPYTMLYCWLSLPISLLLLRHTLYHYMLVGIGQNIIIGYAGHCWLVGY